MPEAEPQAPSELSRPELGEDHEAQREFLSHDPRKLGIVHFAFYRSHLEGLDFAEFSARYLGAGVDVRVARSFLRFTREALMVAAARHGRPAVRRLFVLSPRRLRELQGPSLEDFRTKRDPGNFYTEAELLEAYAEEFPDANSRRAAHARRLLRRQLESLAWLETLAREDCSPDDPLEAWFDPHRVAHLREAGLATIEDLARRIRERPRTWHRRIWGLGTKRGRQLIHWMEQIGALPSSTTTINAPWAPSSRPTRREPAGLDADVDRAVSEASEAIIAPLERFRLPATLDGSQGTNRALVRPSWVGPSNDLDAIHSWLGARANNNANTYSAYRREAERLLLWAIVERRKPLSSLWVDDCSAYRDFLRDLGKPNFPGRSRWIGDGGVERHRPGWRPFKGGLSPRSIAIAFRILNALFRWLRELRYLEGNPWAALAKPPKIEDIDASRGFTRAQWRTVLGACEAIVDPASRARMRFVLLFAYGTGLRLSELVCARTGHVQRVNEDETAIWVLNVVGKGGISRVVPMPAPVMKELNSYMECRLGGPLVPGDYPPALPLIGSLAADQNWALSERRRPARPDKTKDGEEGRPNAPRDPNKPVTANGLYRELKRHFQLAADQLPPKLAADRAHIMAATPHCLRHTHGSHVQSSTKRIDIVQKNLGHASLKTTTIYVHAEIAERAEAMESFAAGWLQVAPDRPTR